MSPEQYFKDIIYPIIDLILKLFIGVFIAVLLYQKGKKDKIRDSVIDLFGSLGAELNYLKQNLYNERVQSLIDILSPMSFKIGLIDKRNSQLAYADLGYKFVIDESTLNPSYIYLHDNTNQTVVGQIYRYLGRLELLLGVKAYEKSIKGLENSLNSFWLEGITIDLDKELTNNIGNIIKKHFAGYKDGLLTRGEYMEEVCLEMAPLLQQLNERLTVLWDKFILPYLAAARKAIHDL